MNTLCESEVLAHKVSDNPDMAHIEEGIKIKPVNVGAYPPSSPSTPPTPQPHSFRISYVESRTKADGTP